MRHELPSLDSLKAFESAARLLSFSLAATELCMSKAAVSYQIRKLEQELDCPLFRRSVRQIYLTDAGQALLKTTQRLFADLSSTLENIKPGERRHDVLIGATTYVALRWLSTRIAKFNKLYPQISIVLHHTVNSNDFRIQDVDFAILWSRIEGRINHTRLREIAMPLFPACSPSLLKKTNIPFRQLKTVSLAKPPCSGIPLLCEDRTFDLWQTWYGEQSIVLSNPRRMISDANVRTQAAIDGQGWTLADNLMQRELDNGLLIAPFHHRLEGYGYVVQRAPSRFLNKNAALLLDWLVEKP